MDENSDRFELDYSEAAADTRFLSARAAQMILTTAIVGCFLSIVVDVVFKTECAVASLGWIVFGPLTCVMVTLGRVERPAKARDYIQVLLALAYFAVGLVLITLTEMHVTYGCLIFQIAVVVVGGVGNVLFMGPSPTRVAVMITGVIRGILSALGFFSRSSGDEPPMGRVQSGNLQEV